VKMKNNAIEEIRKDKYLVDSKDVKGIVNGI
jgi:hypothetical protein